MLLVVTPSLAVYATWLQGYYVKASKQKHQESGVVLRMLEILAWQVSQLQEKIAELQALALYFDIIL